MVQYLNNNVLSYPQLNQVMLDDKSKPLVISEPKFTEKIEHDIDIQDISPSRVSEKFIKEPDSNEMAVFSKDRELQPPAEEKDIKNLIKKLQTREKQTDDYKVVSFLDNFHDNHLNILQNLAQYVNSGEKIPNDFNSLSPDLPDYNMKNSLKYLEDNYFLKKKKIKRSKSKKDVNLYDYPTLYPSHPSFSPNSVKIENNPTFTPFLINPNNMLTNFPNNKSLKFQNFMHNYAESNCSSKIDENNNLLKSPGLDNNLLLSRKSSFPGPNDANFEEFAGFDNNNQFGFPFLQNMTRNTENKDDVIF